jgi:RND family efflux transporter MFP subunit
MKLRRVMRSPSRWPVSHPAGRARAWLALPVLLVLLAIGCRTGAASEGERKQRGAPGSKEVREVELVAVRQRPLEQAVEVSGTLAPDEEVTVAVKVAGRLQSISVDLASPVKKDQPIAEVEPADYRLRVEQALAALAQARAQLGLPLRGGDQSFDVENTAIVRQAQATMKHAQAELARTQYLAKSGLTSQANLEAVEAQATRSETAVQAALEEVRIRQATMRQRQSELSLAQKQLADTVLRAPLDGIVQARLATAGEYLAVGAPVVRIVRIDPLRLRVAIPEREAHSIMAGQTVEVRVDGAPQRHTGLVSRIAPSLEQESRSLLVEADVKNPGTLRPGSFAHARIVVGIQPVLTVPKSAVVVFAGLYKVLLVQGGKAVEKAVTPGKTEGEWTEIVSGLKPGEQIVVRPGSLQHGQPVRVKPGA